MFIHVLFILLFLSHSYNFYACEMTQQENDAIQQRINIIKQLELPDTNHADRLKSLQEIAKHEILMQAEAQGWEGTIRKMLWLTYPKTLYLWMAEGKIIAPDKLFSNGKCNISHGQCLRCMQKVWKIDPSYKFVTAYDLESALKKFNDLDNSILNDLRVLALKDFLKDFDSYMPL